MSVYRASGSGPAVDRPGCWGEGLFKTRSEDAPRLYAVPQAGIVQMRSAGRLWRRSDSIQREGFVCKR
jgi:hypothetical protein